MNLRYFLTAFLLGATGCMAPCHAQELYTVEALAQAPVESTAESPQWYYVISAAKSNVPGDKQTFPANTFPMFANNYVLCNRSQNEARYSIREARLTNEEQFALVRRDGKLYLQNRHTRGCMDGSWGASAKGSPFEAKPIKSTARQYLLRTSGNSPLCIKYDDGFVADRYNYDNMGAKNAGKTTAWYFLPANSLDVRFLMRKQQARRFLATQQDGTTPGEYHDNGSRAKVEKALADAEKSSVATEALVAALAKAIEAAQNDVLMPQTGKSYHIRSASSPYDNRGFYLYVNGDGEPASSHADAAHGSAYVWDLRENNGKLVLVNHATGTQIQPVSTHNMAFTMGKADVPVTFKYLGEKQFNILSGNITYHRSNTDTHSLYTWAGGTNTASAWTLQTVSESELQKAVRLTQVEMLQARTSTGIGNKAAPLLGVRLTADGYVGNVSISELEFDCSKVPAEAVANFAIYHCGQARRLQAADRLKATCTYEEDGRLKVVLTKPMQLALGETTLWLACDITGKATEGQQLSATLRSCTSADGHTVFPKSPATALHPVTVFLTQSVVLACGEHGSKYYRIPAIETAKDGSLVAVADRRINSNVDLPAHVDVYVNRSTDNGRTWNAPVMVAGNEAGSIGYGDAAIVKNRNGRLIVLYNGGKRGLWDSSADEPFRKYKVHSDDNGITWSAPEDITNQLYGSKSLNPETRAWKAMLLTSGRALCTRDGVLMVAVAASVPGKNGFSNYAAVSYDDGDSWRIESAETAWDSGDEAKLVELNNGNILISMRRHGGREFNVSPDKGKTWGKHYTQTELKTPACNGEMLYCTSTVDGYDKNRLIHSLPYASNRSNVSVMLSYDEGKTFSVRKTICPTASAYSALTMLPDGTIGCYFEDGGESMDMVFVSFSIEWLTDGADKYTLPSGGTTGVSQLTSLHPEHHFDLGERLTASPGNGMSVTEGGKKVFIK